MDQHSNHATPRAQCRKLVSKILHGRKQVLVLLWKVSRIEPLTASPPLESLLNEFCGLLVDYIASAHFVLYRRLGEGTERRRAVVEVAKEIYPAIERTTELALAFNDKYADAGPDALLSALERDLSRLSEMLAGRMDLEDRLISAMLGEPYSARGREG